MHSDYLVDVSEIFKEDSFESRADALKTIGESLADSLQSLSHEWRIAINDRRIPRLLEEAVRACALTRDIAFHVDFIATLHGCHQISREATFVKIVRWTESASDELNLCAKVLQELGATNFAARVSRYSKSCISRLERLKAVEAGNLYSAYRYMRSDFPVAIGDESALPAQIDNNVVGFLFTAATWIAHRLAWMMCELKLESGPYVDALRQQLGFLKAEQSAISVLKKKLSDEYFEQQHLELTPDAASLLEIVKGAVAYFESLGQKLEDALICIPEFEDEAAGIAREVTEALLSDIVDFWSGLDGEIVACCHALNSGESIGFGEVFNDSFQPECVEKVSPKTIRVLLIDEKLSPPNNWSAVGLDVRAVAFGATERDAVSTLSELIKLEMKIAGPEKKYRINNSLANKFQEAESYCQIDLDDRQLDVRKWLAR